MSTLSPSTVRRFALPSFATRFLLLHSRIPTMVLAGGVLSVMLGGILLSALTTTDPLWWQAHFSQLGTFQDLSAAFFNGGLILAGVMVVGFAFRVWRDIAKLGRMGGFRGAAPVAFVCLTVIGVNLSMVGLVPMNTDQGLHDRVASSMVLGFLGLLLSSPVMLYRLPRRLIAATVGVFVWLAAGIALFVTATINLTLFEVVAFSAMFTWSGFFVSCLAAHARALKATHALEASQSASRQEGITASAQEPVSLSA